MEILPDRINPSDPVAIYDNCDGNGTATIADTPEFEQAANDFEHNYGAHSWEEIISALECHVAEHGTIDTPYIFDHGIPGGQTFGDETLTTEQLAQFAHLVTPGETIVLGGCSVANGEEGQAYLDAIADATCTTVYGSTEVVLYYETEQNGGLDFLVSPGGDWIGSHGSIVPDDLELRTRDRESFCDPDLASAGLALNSIWIGPSVAPPWTTPLNGSMTTTNYNSVTVHLW